MVVREVRSAVRSVCRSRELRSAHEVIGVPDISPLASVQVSVPLRWLLPSIVPCTEPCILTWYCPMGLVRYSREVLVPVTLAPFWVSCTLR